MTDREQKIEDMPLRLQSRDTDWEAIWRRDRGGVLAAGPSTRTRIRLALRLLRQYGAPALSLLDVGCGSGLLLARAAKTGVCEQCAGSDVAGAAAEAARAAYPQFTFHIFDIQKEHIPHARFDAITCLATLDMVQDDRAALAHMAAMLASGGRLILCVQHNPAYWSKLDDLHAWRRYTLEDLDTLCAAAGLRLIHYFSWGWPMYTWYYKILERTREGTYQRSFRSFWERTLATIAYGLFFFDDLFVWSGKGRQLFAVFEKQ